jgi:hypothetical protein
LQIAISGDSARAGADEARAISGEGPGAQAVSEASNAKATARRCAIRGAIAILSGIAWSGLIFASAHRRRLQRWRLGRRPSAAIMARKIESNFKN